MAQTFVYNFNEQSPQGYLKPANTASAVSPDNVTHAQLRYTDFSSSYVIQGSVVSGANSTFEFSIADNLASEIFKMYYSTDGTTYSVDKTFGGTSGKKLFATADLSGLVTLATTQTISAVKTFTALPESAITPTTAGQLTRKGYVDNLIGYKSCVFWVASYTPNESTALSYTRIYNNTGYTPTLTYLNGLIGTQGLRVTFNRTSSNSDIILPPKLFTDDGFGSKNDAGFLAVSETFAQSSANTVMDLYYVDDVAMTWNVSQASPGGIDYWSRFTLSGGTLTRTTGAGGSAFTNQEFLAATVVRTDSLLASTSTVATSEARKNFRIELRFYD